MPGFDLLPPREQLNGLTQQQRDALKQMHRAVDSQMPPKSQQYSDVHGDVRLLRFLRAFKYDVKEASERYQEFLVWRQQENIDAIRSAVITNNWTPEEIPNAKRIAKYWPQLLYWSRDREGNPVVYDRIGKLDAKGLIAEFGGDESALMTWHIHVMEHKQLLLDRLSREMNCLVFCYEIKDLSGVDRSIFGAKDLMKKTGKDHIGILR